MNKPVTQSKSANLLPDFLCIGAQRSGTTWLYQCLKQHPGIWLTPIKEIHYFNSFSKPFRRRSEVYIRHLRARILDTIKDFFLLRRTTFRNFGWDVKYFFGRRNNDWYISLFRPAVGQIAGEMTPDYAVLDIESIKEVHSLNPELKIIYLMRDPIERSWSAATKDLARQKRRRLDTVSDERLLAKLTGPGPTARSNHLLVLEKWESVFDPKQIFIGFFDSIEDDPAQLLRSIYHFLGVSNADHYIPALAQEKVNSSGRYKSDIPLRFQHVLANQQIDQLTRLSQRFGGPTTIWLRRAEAILAVQEPDS